MKTTSFLTPQNVLGCQDILRVLRILWNRILKIFYFFITGFSEFFPQNIYSLSNSSCLIQIQNFKEHVYRSIRDKQTHLLKATSSKGPLTQSAVTIVLSRLSLCLPVSLVLAFYQPWLALISDDSFSTLSPLNVWQLNFRSRLLFSPLPFSSSFIYHPLQDVENHLQT